MKNILVLTLLFMGTLYLGVRLKNLDVELDNDTESEPRLDGPQEFVKFHQGIRTRSDQDKPGYPVNYRLTELQKALSFSTLKKPTTFRAESNGNGVSSFTERGPGNVPGRTRGLLVDPDDVTHNTWYVGSASGGIWKTTNAGNTWSWLTPNVPNMATTCFAMAESNHNILYAGTGEGFGSIDGVGGMGVFKSSDRGATWAVLANSSALVDVNRIVVDPADENHVVAACNSGIFSSSDGGNNWTKVYTGVVQDLRATPGNFSVLYGGEYRVGVIKSVNGGATWAKSNAAMAATGRVEIAVSPVKTDRIVASAEGNLSGTSNGLTLSSDFYLSDDAGVTWSLVTLSQNNIKVDYLGDQGWYDNAVAFSPYNKDVVYVAGVSAFQVTLGAPITGSSGSYSMNESGTTSFLSLVNFNATSYGGKLEVGSSATHDTVEVRFGPGLTQKAHRFLVPAGSTSGVHDVDYTYQDYVDVPFQVWNIKANQQLMVAFRDQDRNGVFDLLAQNVDATDATQQSREYLFINNVPYSASPNSLIAQAGGQKYQEMYFFWPVLATAATWNPLSLPLSKLQISYSTLSSYSSTVKTVADAYSNYDGVNTRLFVHPDHHNIYPIKQNDASQQFQLLLANDGGIFLSGTSTSPGTTQGEWKRVGTGYNTSQVYGADKKPGAQEYFAGMQDNSTYFTPPGTVSSATTSFNTNTKLAGDGFEVLWHSGDGNKMIGGSQSNNFSRSLDGGTTWSAAISGFPLSGSVPNSNNFPFISKLASSKQAPDNIYSVGNGGVWRSTNFGGNWTLTSIDSGWGTMTSFTDVEVSRANPNIVWAGSGQFGTTTLFVSTNAGQAFTAVPNPAGYTLGAITRIATHPLEPNTAYALYSFAKTAKIMKTTDLGQTWTDISGFGPTGHSSTRGFPDVAVYSLYVRLDDPNIIWAGTEIGIVESLDGGATWAILTSFPAVGIWDMKGQDKEIVIGTHGRGIWTASVSYDQIGASKILASGTTPQSKFAMLINAPYKYDSILLKFTTTSNSSNTTSTVKFSPPDSGTYVLQIANVPAGGLSMQTISYRGGLATNSASVIGTNFKLSAYQQKYYDYMIDLSKFSLNGFNLQPFGESNSSLQSQHNYAASGTETATLLVPIIVSSGSSSFIYDDVALVQPASSGAVFGQRSFNDYVIAEATKDGLNWIPISNGYNSSANADWLSAYNANKSGDISMTKTESFDLKTNFQAGDTLLIRFRLTANGDNTISWGWSIDNLYVQQTPTAVEPSGITALTIYPNPSSRKFFVSYSLSQGSDVTMSVWDVMGRKVISEDLGRRPAGKNEAEIDLDGTIDGVYLARVKTADGEKTVKLLIKK